MVYKGQRGDGVNYHFQGVDLGGTFLGVDDFTINAKKGVSTVYVQTTAEHKMVVKNIKHGITRISHVA